MRVIVVTSGNEINDYFNEVEFINVGQSIHSLPFSFVFVTKKATNHKLYNDWFKETLEPRLSKKCTLIEEI